MSCPDIIVLNHLLGGSLDVEQEAILSRHIEVCQHCRDRLDRAVGSERTLRAVVRNLRGNRELSDTERNVIETCASDPNIFLGEGAEAESRERRRLRSMPLPAGIDPFVIPLGPGSRLGTYEIIEQLGRGGMGVVWKARDPHRDRFVAIKVLEGQVIADPSHRSRFLREARAAGAVEHRNVVRMYGVEETPVPCLIMEYVDGPSLKTYLTKSGSLKLSRVLQIGIQIAHGLAALHAKKVTHRDIKPANLMIEKSTGLVKLTDFGVAHIDGDSQVTLDGCVSGTPAYMSPEQAKGDSADHRSDLFSLGSVLYTMVTGQSPFGDERTFGALLRVRETEPLPPQAINPNVPASLSNLIRRLHSKDPDLRPYSAAEVARLLHMQLEQLNRSSDESADDSDVTPPLDVPLPAPPISEAPPPTQQVDSDRQPNHRLAAASSSRQTRVLRLAAGILLLAVIAGVGLVLSGQISWPMTSSPPQRGP